MIAQAKMKQISATEGSNRMNSWGAQYSQHTFSKASCSGAYSPSKTNTNIDHVQPVDAHSACPGQSQLLSSRSYANTPHTSPAKARASWGDTCKVQAKCDHQGPASMHSRRWNI